jgi:hypothetical protein
MYMTQPASLIRARTIAVPFGSAAVLAAAATFLEARTVGYAWNACDVGVNASANGLYLLFIAMPALWVTQTALIGAPAPLLALLSRNRLVVTAAMALLAISVVACVAWAFFVHSGLPIGDDAICTSPQPGWWPTWLPPSPSPLSVSQPRLSR